MSFNLTKKMRYVRDRCVNAYWMLRTGKFRLILKSIYVELSYRINRVRHFLNRIDIKVSIQILRKEPPLDNDLLLGSAEVPGSAFVNRCKVLPPSYRPTVSRGSTLFPFLANPVVVANELKTILSVISIKECDTP
jgi:hypothetical protein